MLMIYNQIYILNALIVLGEYFTDNDLSGLQ